MSLWWVNLGEEYKPQHDASKLWCPNRTIAGDGSLKPPQWHWKIIQDVQPGDFIVVCKDARITGFAIANGPANNDRPKPPNFDRRGRWYASGWSLDVTFVDAPTAFPRGNVISGLFQGRQHRGPINSGGQGTQVYMAEVNEADAPELFRRISERISANSSAWIDEALKKRPIERTTRDALVSARVGQGAFRRDLMKVWNGRCCATGLSVSEMLRASHIKPWSTSSDSERLDPYNGLLLAAHFDAAFDAGLITLSDEGKWLVMKNMDDAELTRAGLINLHEKQVKGLCPEHLPYIRQHRAAAQRI
jgi:hypothetical protein